MPLPTNTKLRRGDIVALHATVVSDFDPQTDGVVYLDIAGQVRCIFPENIAGVVNRKFEPGEIVRVAEHGHRLYGAVRIVEAVSSDGKALWLRCEAHPVFETVAASAVELFEETALPSEGAEAAQ